MLEENFTYEDVRNLALDPKKKTLKDLGGPGYLEKIKDVIDDLKINAKTKRDLLRIKKAEEYSKTIIKKRLERILINVLFDFTNDKEYNEELRFATEKERNLYNMILFNLKKCLDECMEYIKSNTTVSYIEGELVLVKVLEPIESKGIRFEKGEIALIPLNIVRKLELEGKVERLERV